jgi:hypothetical protein
LAPCLAASAGAACPSLTGTEIVIEINDED